MILVTGGAGFIGQRLVQRLVDEGHSVRILIRPSASSPRLPQGLSVQAAISSLADPRGLRAALVGVDAIYHLAAVDWLDPAANFRATETEGTRNLLDAAQDAGVGRFVFVSHLGADRAAAFAALKAKGIAEEFVRQSPLAFTILRSGLVFGPRDHFTTGLAKLLAFARVFALPLDGRILMQPLWIEDLVSCLTWCMAGEETVGQTIEVGGPEHISLRRVCEMIRDKAGLDTRMISGRPSYLRLLVSLLKAVKPRLPVSNYWLDYFAANRICELDTLPRAFHLLPARFSQKTEYLAGVDWRQILRTEMAAPLLRPTLQIE
ncbi:MAG: NAD(P)H-binding protein [Anaerolineales bacterium]